MTSNGRSVASYRGGQHHTLCRLGSTKQRGAKGITMADGVQHLPKPVQTNSLRKENGGQDITIDLIRRGSGTGWGSALKSKAHQTQVFSNVPPSNNEESSSSLASLLIAPEQSSFSGAARSTNCEAKIEALDGQAPKGDLLVCQRGDQDDVNVHVKSQAQITQTKEKASCPDSSYLPEESSMDPENIKLLADDEKLISYSKIEQFKVYGASYAPQGEQKTQESSIVKIEDQFHANLSCTISSDMNNENVPPVRILIRNNSSGNLAPEKLQTVEHPQIETSDQKKATTTYPDGNRRVLQAIDFKSENELGADRGFLSALEQQKKVLCRVLLVREEKKKKGGAERKQDEKGRRKSQRGWKDKNTQARETCSDTVEARTAILDLETSSQLKSASRPCPPKHTVDAGKTNALNESSLFIAGSEESVNECSSLPDWSPNIAVFSFQINSIWSSCCSGSTNEHLQSLTTVTELAGSLPQDIGGTPNNPSSNSCLLLEEAQEKANVDAATEIIKSDKSHRRSGTFHNKAKQHHSYNKQKRHARHTKKQ